jgi:hypothetical protein
MNWCNGGHNKTRPAQPPTGRPQLCAGRVSLCHHVYPGNVADAEEFPIALARIVALLDRHGMARDSVTLVLDKGSAALANTLDLEQAGVGWISALPWSQPPEELRERPAQEFVEQRSAGGAGRRRTTRRAWQRIPVRRQVFSVVCQRAVAWPDHHAQQSAPVDAALRPIRYIARLASPAQVSAVCSGPESVQ